MIDDDARDAFQAALIEALAGARTLDDPALDAHRAWVRAFDPALTEAARALVKAWSRRDPER